MNFLLSQSNFELEDLNPNSEFYGQVIGPANFLGEISIIFLDMNIETLVGIGSIF